MKNYDKLKTASLSHDLIEIKNCDFVSFKLKPFKNKLFK